MGGDGPSPKNVIWHILLIHYEQNLQEGRGLTKVYLNVPEGRYIGPWPLHHFAPMRIDARDDARIIDVSQARPTS